MSVCGGWYPLDLYQEIGNFTPIIFAELWESSYLCSVGMVKNHGKMIEDLA